MSYTFKARMEEWASWYLYNKDRVPREDLAKRLDFQEKALDGIFEILTYVYEDITKRKVSNLWLPKGVTMHGSPKEFG